MLVDVMVEEVGDDDGRDGEEEGDVLGDGDDMVEVMNCARIRSVQRIEV